MLYLTILGLLLLVIGGIIIKKSVKLAIIGVILALGGAAMALFLGAKIIHEDLNKSAKCASLDGVYGGSACYVQGVEKDLNNIENFVKKDL